MLERIKLHRTKIKTMFTLEKFKRLMNILLFIISVAVSFQLGVMANDLYKKHFTQPNPFTRIHTSKDTAVSVSERGELIIINRVTGHTVVLDNAVGMSVFNSYANSIYKEYNKK